MMPAGDISWLFSACRGITPILFKNSQKEDLFRPPLDKRAYPELDGSPLDLCRPISLPTAQKRVCLFY